MRFSSSTVEVKCVSTTWFAALRRVRGQADPGGEFVRLRSRPGVMGADIREARQLMQTTFQRERPPEIGSDPTVRLRTLRADFPP